MTAARDKIFSPDGSAFVDMQVAADALDKFQRSARRRIPALLLGLIAIIAGFSILVVNLDHARREAVIRQQLAEKRQKDAEKRATQLATDLSNAGNAFRARDMAKLGALLKVAIIQSETNAQAASIPVTLSAAEAPRPAPIPVPVLAPQTVVKPIDLGDGTAVGPQTVYIQFAGLIDRAQIVALNGALKQAGWKVAGPSGERTGNAAGFNEVRYSSDANRAAAEALAKAVTTAGVGNRPVTIRKMSMIGGSTLELWLSHV